MSILTIYQLGCKLFMIKEQHNNYRENKKVYYKEKVHVTVFCSRKFIINVVSVRKLYAC